VNRFLSGFAFIRWAPGERALGMARQAGIVDGSDLGGALEHGGDGPGAPLVLAHPDPEGPDPAHHEEAVDRARDRAHRVLEPGEPLPQRAGARDEGPADDVRVAP